MPKASEAGLKPMLDTPLPVPDTVKHCGDAGALSCTHTCEERAPAICGLKVTLIVQVPEAAIVVTQLFVCVKLVLFPPVTATFVITKFALPVFVTVTEVGLELVPTVIAENVMDVGVKLIRPLP